LGEHKPSVKSEWQVTERKFLKENTFMSVVVRLGGLELNLSGSEVLCPLALQLAPPLLAINSLNLMECTAATTKITFYFT